MGVLEAHDALVAYPCGEELGGIRGVGEELGVRAAVGEPGHRVGAVGDRAHRLHVDLDGVGLPSGAEIAGQRDVEEGVDGVDAHLGGDRARRHPLVAAQRLGVGGHVGEAEVVERHADSRVEGFGAAAGERGVAGFVLLVQGGAPGGVAHLRHLRFHVADRQLPPQRRGVEEVPVLERELEVLRAGEGLSDDPPAFVVGLLQPRHEHTVFLGGRAVLVGAGGEHVEDDRPTGVAGELAGQPGLPDHLDDTAPPLGRGLRRRSSCRPRT